MRRFSNSRSTLAGLVFMATLCMAACSVNHAPSTAGSGNAPVLAYGTATGVGPFVCESATTGVTCTADGKGFQISRSGITPV